MDWLVLYCEEIIGVHGQALSACRRGGGAENG